MDTPIKCMWRPDQSKQTRQDVFRKRINNNFGLKLETYEDLYKWSVSNYPEFWEELWQFCGLKFSQQYEEVIDSTKGIADIPEWFHGSRLNYTENLLQHEDNKIAIYSTGEGQKEVKTRTFGELRRDVAKFAAAMRKAGIKQGDRVVGYLPNCLEAVEAMLAAASIGAVWSSTSPDFGVTGVLDRFSQIQPKMIFSVDGVVYNGKQHDHLVKLQQVVECLPDLQTVIIVPYVTTDTQHCDISHIKNSCFLEDFLASGCHDAGDMPCGIDL
ncbi:Acetoacetyl-CoA synthetase [Lamellibrachia satsuma]|nr:Acetoacetyl-CoA synthetase [Lamellibrachia satsuma]